MYTKRVGTIGNDRANLNNCPAKKYACVMAYPGRTRKFVNRRLVVFLTAMLLVLPAVKAQADNYIIVYKNHAKRQNALKRPTFTVSRSFHIIPAVAAQLDANQVEQLRQNPDIEYIEPDYKVYALGGPFAAAVSSSDITALSSTQTTPYGVTMVNAPTAWSKTKGRGARVAVLDTGISMYHPDRGNVAGSANFVSGETVEDFSGHGTHTAGTISAADNSIGVVGVAPQADLLIAKVLSNDGSGDTSWVISGIEWAVDNNAKVISMSLGSPDYSAALDSACSSAFAAGALLVAAAGNDGTSAPSYPAALSSVIAVAAIDQNKNRASFSSYGSDIALAAPGVSVYSTVPASIDTSATADAVWSSTSHQANVIVGSAAGSVSGTICNCGLATGTGSDVCPPSVAGNIALIQRGQIYFSQKVAYAQSKGAIGAIIYNNVSGNFYGTIDPCGTSLVVASISDTDGAQLAALAQSGITGTVSVDATLYDYYDGTSMACPHVAGVAALIFAAEDGQISPSEVRSVLENSAQDLGTAGWDQYFGYGLVNADAALKILVPHTCNAVWTLGYGLPADISRNCFVSWDDLRLFTQEWLTSGCSGSNNWCDGADINDSGTVNISDFSKLAAQWLSCNDPQHINCN
jgi:serine protease